MHWQMAFIHWFIVMLWNEIRRPTCALNAFEGESKKRDSAHNFAFLSRKGQTIFEIVKWAYEMRVYPSPQPSTTAVSGDEKPYLWGSRKWYVVGKAFFISYFIQT